MGGQDRLFELAEKHDRYPDAYRILLMVMSYALEKMGEKRHLSGEEFLEWLVRMLKEHLGYMGRWLLKHHGFDDPMEVGRAIFELVEGGVFSRREEDTLEAFAGKGNLAESFRPEFENPDWWETEGPDWRFLPVFVESGQFQG